jgi:sarcosine oxidase
MGVEASPVQSFSCPNARCWHGCNPRPDLFAPKRSPVFILHVEERDYYGFPVFSIPGFKFGKYHHLFETIDPDRLSEPNRRDEQVLRQLREKYPDGAGSDDGAQILHLHQFA